MGIKLPQAKSYCYSAPPPQPKTKRSAAGRGDGRAGGLFSRAQAILRRAEHLAVSALHLPRHDK